jgi:hypothetical protein
MNDLLGCVLKLGVLVGLLILLWQIFILGVAYWVITTLSGVESSFNWKEFWLFVLGVIVLWGMFSKSK